MEIKKITQNIWYGLWKLIWAILCYTISAGLALISGFFTFKFYSDGSAGYDLYAMGGMAICLELVKLILSIGYPYLKNRDKKNETKILLVLKISYVLSVLASLYYLLLGSDIAKSPASRTISMLYEYIPALDIIPLKFSQFIGTISLTILIEFFIIFLPIIAPIMKKEKRQNQKIYAVTNFEKIVEIITVIPQMMIDKLHQKVLNYAESKNVENKEVKKPSNVARMGNQKKVKLRLLKGNDIQGINKPSNNYEGRKEENKNVSNELINQKDEKNPAQNNAIKSNVSNPVIIIDSENDILNNSALDNNRENHINSDKEILLKAIYELEENDICPSVKQLNDHTGITKKQVYDIKKELENDEIIKTEGNKTLVLC